MARRSGFTLIEVIVALLIFTVGALSLGAVTADYIHQVTVGDLRAAATHLANDRIALVRADPKYADLETSYGGTESGFPTLEGFSRTTVITTVTAGNSEFKRITVTIEGPGLTPPVSRTAAVAIP